MSITMEEDIDPRLKAIMDKLNKSVEKKQPDEVVEVRAESPKPPTTFDEFLKAEKLVEWPYRITSENVLDLSEEKHMLGSIDDIKAELRESARIDLTVLNDLENRLRLFEGQIDALSNQVIVKDPDLPDDVSHLPMSVSKAFLTETKEGDVLKVHPSRRKKKKDQNEEIRKKTVESCNFPGFRPGELTELPAKLETPQILNRVTKAQDFNPGLKKFWKKIFQSEASCAVMQDGFWWFFIENFEKEKKQEQSLLFDRLADSFVALFISINTEIKDKILSMYADNVCQAIYVAFLEAFPESIRNFQDEFKQKLVNTVTEWITGIQPIYGSWINWDLKRLQVRGQQPAITESVTQVNIVRDAPTSDAKPVLPMADFHKAMQMLGSSERTSNMVAVIQVTNNLVSREVTKMSVPGPEGSSNVIPINALVPINQSRLAQCGSPRRQNKESSCMGRGSDMERVLFNLDGRSPLVTHFLRMRNLIDFKDSGRKVRRTQLLKPPPETKTYRQFIKETVESRNKLSKEYNKICDITKAEIAKIEKQQRETTRRIDELQRNIANCRSSTEVRQLGDRILDPRHPRYNPTKCTDSVRVKSIPPAKL